MDKYKAQEKYMNEKTTRITLRLKNELMEEFKKNIAEDENYKSATQFLKEKIEEYNKSKAL